MRRLLRWLTGMMAVFLLAGLLLPVFATETPEPTPEPEPVPSEPAPASEPAPEPVPSDAPAPEPTAPPAPVPEPTQEEEPPPPEPIRLDPFDPGPERPPCPEGDIERFEDGLHYDIPEDWTAQDVIDWFIGHYDLDADCFAVSFYCPATGERADWNQDAYFLAGSTYKLPLNMYYYEQEAAGVYSPSTVIGETTLAQAHMESLLWSMNDISHEMLYNLGPFYVYKQLMAEHYGGIPDDEIPIGFWSNNYYSTRFMINVLTCLYDRLDEFPELAEYLLQAMPGYYLQKYNGAVPVLHKYGTVDMNFHDVGILFTEEPCLVAIYTHNYARSVFGEELVARLGKALLDYQTQRTELNRLAAEQAASAEPVTETPDEETEAAVPVTEAPTDAPVHGAEAGTESTAPAQTESAAPARTDLASADPEPPADRSAGPAAYLPILLIPVGMAAAAVGIIALLRRKKT